MDIPVLILLSINLFLAYKIVRSLKCITMTNSEFIEALKAVVEALKNVQPDTGTVPAEAESLLAELQAETNRLTTSTTTSSTTTEETTTIE